MPLFTKCWGKLCAGRSSCYRFKRPAPLFNPSGQKKLMGSWFVFIKHVAKTWLDNHVLPGTTAGTEILWLYLIQWKRDMHAIVSVMLFDSRPEQPEVSNLEQVISNAPATGQRSDS